MLNLYLLNQKLTLLIREELYFLIFKIRMLYQNFSEMLHLKLQQETVAIQE